ncbi:N-acetyl-gamma-glutamyl-phosphate reductase, partial [Bacteroidota bacterium]
MVNIGIIGGAGYTAGELIRILLHHPEANIVFVHSNSNFGKKVYEVHADLIGETDLVFSEIEYNQVDVIFLCMGHGMSKEFVNNKDIPNHIKIIDLSHDFRLKADGNNFVYGLPELNKEDIKSAKYVANPGCFATGIQLAILPLANHQLLIDDIHVNGITGSTGAGQKPSPTNHFSWRNSNVSVYKAFKHQHLGEINQSIKQLQGNYKSNVNFLPVRGNFTRGIYISAYTLCDKKEEDIINLYEDFYKDQPFV